MASSSFKKRDGGRLHLRLPPELKRQIEQYALRNGTTVTAITIRAFIRILASDPLSQQPTGIQWTSFEKLPEK